MVAVGSQYRNPLWGCSMGLTVELQYDGAKGVHDSAYGTAGW